MSIDHGKVLAMADRLDFIVQHGAFVDDELNVPMVILTQEEAKRLADELRTLAQPAEAVELPTPYHYADGGKGEPLFTANQVRAAVAVATDAAQGAVATVCLVGERYAHGHMVSVELQLAGEDAPAPKIGDRYYTHPQAAPAQGDGERWIAGYMQGANDYVGGTQGALDQDELRADAEMAQRHYDAELAAAPSQEVRADPGIEVGGTQHGPAPSQEPVVVDAAMIERAKGPLPASFLIPASDWQRGFNDALKLIYEELPAALRAAINTKQK